jgi:hypothetical protein
VRSSRTLRGKLDTLRELVGILRKGSYTDCVDAISGLRAALRALETEEASRFHREEMKLCASLRVGSGATEALMEELAADREAMREAFDACRRALKAFNVHGDSGPLCQAAERLVKILSRRLDRQQRELVPALERQFRAQELEPEPVARLADAS